MKIGLITQHCLYNYGSVLQSESLYKYLEELGNDVEIIDFWPKNLYEQYHNSKHHTLAQLIKKPRVLLREIVAKINEADLRLSKEKYADFRKHWKLSKLYIGEDSINLDPPKYDAYVTGSDCIWHPDFITPARCLNFASKFQSPKISYAPSLSIKEFPNSDVCSKLRHMLSSIDRLSCRERHGAEILKSILSKEVSTVLDPIFLHNKSWWKKYIGDAPIVDGDYIFAYVVHPTASTSKILKRLHNAYNMPVILAVVDLKSQFILYHNKIMIYLGPNEFLNLLFYAKYVAASSFHGVAFSIHFEKNFYAINDRKNDTRIEDILERMGLSKRLVRNDESFNISDIDYSETAKLIAEELKNSENYLKSSLMSEKTTC